MRFKWAFLLSLPVLVLTARAPAIVDARDRAMPEGVSLELPALYVALSPLSRLLDTLTLFSNQQTAAFFITIAALAAAVMLAGPSRSGRRPPFRILRATGVMLPGIAVLEAAVIFAPRPMAYLKVADPDIVRVDFHSHTRASRDANQRITGEDRRRWHRDGGFDIGYISDHVRFSEAALAARRNPSLAGNGVSELSAVEGRYHKIMSTIMLGLTEADTMVLDSKGHLLPGTPASGRAPVTIVAIPNRNLDSVTVESLDSIPHFAGLELVDAAPRGLGQLDREEEKIRRIAQATGLVLVAASNNHGYGRTVAAWNLVTIPGWRSLTPDSVGRLIEQPFRNRRPDAVTIVKRLRPRTHGIELPLTLPIALWQILGSLTVAERAVWLAWIWVTASIFAYSRARRATRH